MIRDLTDITEPRHVVTADVVVIGAGLAGLTMASRLSKQGLRVAVLESGGMVQTKDKHPLNQVVHRHDIYRGAEDGRFRCLGGTSTRWGGAMLPFLPSDLEYHLPDWDATWPLSLDDLKEEFAIVERLFNLPEGPYALEAEDDPPTSSPTFRARSAKLAIFRMRNVAHVFRQDLPGDGLDVWLHATATSFQFHESGRLKSVTARSLLYNELVVEAPFFAVAAGAIESTRLLLLMDTQQNDRIFSPYDVLGRHFYDHLSSPAASVQPFDRHAFLLACGLRFAPRGMRDWRLEPNEALRRQLKTPSAFAHIATRSNSVDGFTALRGIYRSLQGRSLPRLDDLTLLAGNAGWLAKAVSWRFLQRRLYPPVGAAFLLNLVIEQMPFAGNRITLLSDRKDANGSPMVQIDWRIREPDLEAFRVLQSALLRYWSNSRFSSLATLVPTTQDVWQSQMAEGGGIYHAGGTTRMGNSQSDAVVDAELRSFAVSNLYVVSTSSFPSGGSANPSFMLLAFAIRTADRIAKAMSGKAA